MTAAKFKTVVLVKTECSVVVLPNTKPYKVLLRRYASFNGKMQQLPANVFAMVLPGNVDAFYFQPVFVFKFVLGIGKVQLYVAGYFVINQSKIKFRKRIG